MGTIETLLIYGFAVFVSLCILYLVIKWAVMNGTRRIFQELQKTNGTSETPTPRPNWNPQNDFDTTK